jgi:hypothetical protein
LHRDYVKKTAYAQFGLLYRFHTTCTQNLLSFFDLGGDANVLKNEGEDEEDSEDEEDEGGCWPAFNRLYVSSPRRFHLLNDIVSISLACSDLSSPSGPHWCRQLFQGSWEHPDSGSSFRNAFNDEMEYLYNMAINCKAEFGSHKHFRVWAHSLECKAEMVGDSLSKLGTRLLHKVSPMWRLKDNIDEILDRCSREGEDEDVDEDGPWSLGRGHMSCPF